MKKKLYLAGKISRNDWRTSILGHRPGSVELEWDEDTLLDGVYNTSYVQQYDDFTYVGPFFVSCDHGCYHKSVKHRGYNVDEEDNEHGTGPFGCSGAEHDRLVIERHRKHLFAANCNRILQADVCLVFINEQNCHGTLMEIGFMQAMRQDFWVGFGPNCSDPEDMWMAQQLAKGIYNGPIEAVWKRFKTEVLMPDYDQKITQCIEDIEELIQIKARLVDIRSPQMLIDMYDARITDLSKNLILHKADSEEIGDPV